MLIKNIVLKVAVLSAVIAVFPVLAQQVEPKPTCNHCRPRTFPRPSWMPIPKSHRAQAHGSAGSIGGSGESTNRYRQHLSRKVGPGNGAGKTSGEAVAEHEQMSEVYYVIEGSATFLTGPDLVDAKRRPDHPEDRERTKWTRL